MPYYKQANPGQKYKALIAKLAAELSTKPAKPPKQIRLAAKPVIIEEEQRVTRRCHVYVIWDKWSTVPDEDRGAIILDAYEHALGQIEASRISVAMGVTVSEAKEIGII